MHQEADAAPLPFPGLDESELPDMSDFATFNPDAEPSRRVGLPLAALECGGNKALQYFRSSLDAAN